ncbi:MAG: hypothetical protein LIO54_03555 [Oscillospiraceae bacterium]|nr:hypothetical protein [Oscillospiraceae bacterium]
MEENAFAPHCLIAEFADGQRVRFPCFSEKHGLDLIALACETHGDLLVWNAVTDENYENGVYVKLIPPPPTVFHVDLTDYDGELNEDGLPPDLISDEK